MPISTSRGKKIAKKFIEDRIKSPDFRILDLGCGKGTYARLLEKPCYKIGIDGVDYREKFSLMDFYNEFYQHDIRDIEFLKSLGHFDLAIAGDVLEHMNVKEAQSVLQTMYEISDAVLVAFPFTWSKKGDRISIWEIHVQDDLTRQTIAERYPNLNPLAIFTTKRKPWCGNECYGYYIWERSQ